MRYRVLFAIACVLAIVAGCKVGGGGGGTASRVAELCSGTTNLTAELCRCIGEKAQSDLSPQAGDLLIAILDKQEQRAAELRGKLPVDEVMKAGMFMVNAPAACGAAAAVPPPEKTP
jgi:hypothetical protein